jgi:hypothetical protein
MGGGGKLVILGLVALCQAQDTARALNDLVVRLPGLTFTPGFRQFSGYLNASAGHYLHYWSRLSLFLNEQLSLIQAGRVSEFSVSRSDHVVVEWRTGMQLIGRLFRGARSFPQQSRQWTNSLRECFLLE